MKKSTGFLLAILLVSFPAISQGDCTQRPTLGIYFFFNDFKTAADIRATSLRSVIRDGQFARLKEMSAGLAINYINGLSNHFDFTTTLTGAFLDYIDQGGQFRGQDNLLLEGDASLKAKLFPNHYWVSPFLQIGTGISKYKGYWGIFMPVGTGFQVNLFQEAYFVFNAQYRVAVTNTVSHHFFYSIGIAGTIGRKKAPNGSSLPEEE